MTSVNCIGDDNHYQSTCFPAHCRSVAPENKALKVVSNVFTNTVAVDGSIEKKKEELTPTKNKHEYQNEHKTRTRTNTPEERL